MENTIILAVVAVVLAFALLRIKKRAKGGCCGSGSNTIRSHKKLTEPKLGQRIMTVEGMRCENCEARVENALNRLDGIVCKANWKKKSAVVSYSREVADSLLKETVEKMGYRVVQIQ